MISEKGQQIHVAPGVLIYRNILLAEPLIERNSVGSKKRKRQMADLPQDVTGIWRVQQVYKNDSDYVDDALWHQTAWRIDHESLFIRSPVWW